MLKFLAILAVSLPLTSAGFRCTFGNWACTAGCVMLGQTSGLCDDDWNCHCSENKISLNNLRTLLPSRCHLGTKFCEATCHAIGRRNGICNDYGCDCDNRYLDPTEFLLCAAESTCRTHCQAQGKSTGECVGWSCECVSSQSDQDMVNLIKRELEE
eukprot:TRINITY_DN14177_c0_g1_i1.p1 TRINITY_DN14177_c0_g1~~TRINITY_DN14177_c0_g1_i1.p1  ORF type:complete len:165 (+),score=5.45 TRINITY_DN14177_c0_g1_i1:30-497(+)